MQEADGKWLHKEAPGNLRPCGMGRRFTWAERGKKLAKIFNGIPWRADVGEISATCPAEVRHWMFRTEAVVEEIGQSELTCAPTDALSGVLTPSKIIAWHIFTLSPHATIHLPHLCIGSFSTCSMISYRVGVNCSSCGTFSSFPA